MKKIIVVTGLLLMISTVSASDSDWWNTSYQYRVPITLTGNTSGSQTYYQLMLNVSYNTHMQSDFDDIRFTDSSKNLLSAWLENKTDSSYATIWINFTDTPDNGDTKTYYMYYGNSEVSNYWNGTNTFIFYDDFEYTDDLINHGWTLVDGTYNTNYNTDTVYAKRGSRSLKIYPASQQTIYLKRIFNATNKIAVDVDYYETDSSETSIYTGLQINKDIDSLIDYSPWCYDSTNYKGTANNTGYTSTISRINGWHKYTNQRNGINAKSFVDNVEITEAFYNSSQTIVEIGLKSGSSNSGWDSIRYWDSFRIHKYISNPPTYTYSTEEEYTLSSESETPTPIPTTTPTPIPTIETSNYVIQNQTLYITKASAFQYRITTNQFAYGGSRNINTVICDNNLTDISGWIKIDTDQSYDADYTFFVNVNDTSYQSRIVTLKQELVDSSIISKTYKRSCLVDGYEIYSYNTTIYIISVIPNPIYFYWNLEDRIIQFGDKKFNNQTLAFTQLNFDDQYEFMNTSSRDEVTMKFKTVSPETASGAELKGLTGLLLNVLSKIPYIGKSLKNVLYYPLFFIQTLFDFIFTFLDIIVNDWWYALMTLEIVCIFSASRKKGYSNIIEDYIKTHIKIIKFVYEVIILNMINLIITIIVTIKDMIKWW